METSAGRAQLIYNKSCLHANLPPRLPFACLSCVPSTALSLGALRKNPSGSVQKATAGTVDPPRIWSIWPQQCHIAVQAGRDAMACERPPG